MEDRETGNVRDSLLRKVNEELIGGECLRPVQGRVGEGVCVCRSGRSDGSGP